MSAELNEVEKALVLILKTSIVNVVRTHGGDERTRRIQLAGRAIGLLIGTTGTDRERMETLIQDAYTAVNEELAQSTHLRVIAHVSGMPW